MHLLFTGASGFLGKNTLPVLSQQFQISTVGLTPDEDYQINLCTTVPDLPEHFDIILHAAGKAHSVPKTEAEKQVFYDINYQGTVNLCQALEKADYPVLLYSSVPWPFTAAKKAKISTKPIP